MTPFCLQVISEYVEEMGKDIVVYAMQISIEANKKTIQYIKAILNNWKKAGIKTVADAKQESTKNKGNKKKQYNNYEQRDYSKLDLNKIYANSQGG